MITGNSAIPIFEVKAHFDLTGKPKVILTNNSSGTMQGCQFVFELYSPSNLLIPTFHNAAFGAWTTRLYSEDLPTALGALEFGTYRLKVTVTVSTSVFSIEKEIDIKRPLGNKPGANHNYGKADAYSEVRCHNGTIYVEDRTSTSYDGSKGTLISRKWTLIAPPDGTGGIPAPEIVEQATTASFKIPFNGKNFTLQLISFYLYDLGQNATASIGYTDTDCFPVVCNIDLCKVISEFRSYEKRVKCSPTPETERTLLLMNTKLSMALIGKMQPGCGINIAELVSEIIELGDFSCKCVMDYSTGIGSQSNCGCEACTIIASLAGKVATSGIYQIKINKESASDCGKVTLVSNCSELTGVDVEVVIAGTTQPATTQPATTQPVTTQPVTTQPVTTQPATTVPPTTIPQFKAYWGWKNNINTLTAPQIEESPNFAMFDHLDDVLADYRSNTNDLYLWFAIPITEPIPLQWYANPLSFGPIGGTVPFFRTITIVGGYYFSITDYPSSQTQNPIELSH